MSGFTERHRLSPADFKHAGALFFDFFPGSAVNSGKGMEPGLFGSGF